MTDLLLFWESFKTGLFSVGGGMATIPFLTQMSQTHPEWFTLEQLADMIAVSESTPGPIGINMATYVGTTVGGIPGALIATLSLVLPSIIVITIIAGFLKKYNENKWVQSAFSGLRPAVAGLIAAAGFTVLKLALVDMAAVEAGQSVLYWFDWRTLLLFAGILAATQIKKLQKLHPLIYIGIGAVVGILCG